MADSCSLTPPLSPQNGDVTGNKVFLPKDLKLNVEVPYFSCQSSNISLFTDLSSSYVKTGHFQKILEHEVLFDISCPALTLYSRIFPSKSALRMQLTQLFTLTKKKFKELRSSASCQRNSSAISRTKSFELRYEICEFLHYVKNSLLEFHSKLISRIEASDELWVKKYLHEFMHEFHRLLLIIGRLTSIPNKITTDATSTGTNRVSAASYEYVHLCLDFWWSALEILHVLQAICDRCSIVFSNKICIDIVDEPRNFFLQTALLVICDLCHLAFRNYVNCGSCFSLSSPFLCSCVKEFWLLLIRLLDRRHSTINDMSFWCSLHQVFQYMSAVAKVSESNTVDVVKDYFSLSDSQLKLDSPNEFFLWLIIHIAPLYRYNEEGTCVQSKQLESDSALVKFITGSIFANEANTRNEKQLRSILSLLLSLVQLWGSCGDVLFKLTDFFIHRINEQFNAPSKEVQVSYLFKTSKCWLQKLQEFREENKNATSKDNSFQVYLKILAILLKPSATLERSLWLQFRGRFCSKFTPKKFGELSEVGLQNFFSVMLTVSCVVPLDTFEEFFLKMSSLTNMVQSVCKDFRKSVIFFKALFALVTIYQNQDNDIEKLVSKVMLPVFEAACRDYSCLSTNSARQVDLSNALLFYVDNVREIFENSKNLSLSEHSLISPGFLVLLGSFQTDLSHLLTSIYKILQAIRYVGETQCIDGNLDMQLRMVLRSVFSNILPFIESHVKTNAPPLEIAQIACLLTYFASCFPTLVSEFSNYTQTSLFHHFGSGQNVNPSVTCRFLKVVLTEEIVLFESLKLQIPDIFSLILQSWIKCCILVVPPQNDMNELTCAILQQREVFRTFPIVEHMSLEENVNHDVLCLKFFYLIGQSYKQCSLLQEKSVIKEKFMALFRSFAQHLGDHVKQNTSSMFLAHVYKTCGGLVEYCTPLLHVKFSSGNVLPMFIDTLLLPHLVFPKDKFLPATLSRHAKEHLPSFLKGLASLDYRNDAYVKRKMKEIIVHYLNNLNLTNNVIVNLALSAASGQSEDVNFDLFLFFIDVVKEEIGSNILFVNGFQFFAELMKRLNLLIRRKICDSIMRDLFYLLLRYEGPAVKPVKDLLEMLFTFLKGNANTDYRKQVLIASCQDLVKEKLAWSTYKVFRMLEYLTKHFPIIMSEMIPFLSKHIEYLECQRGSGLDANLRREMRNFVDKVQNGLSKAKNNQL